MYHLKYKQVQRNFTGQLRPRENDRRELKTEERQRNMARVVELWNYIKKLNFLTHGSYNGISQGSFLLN